MPVIFQILVISFALGSAVVAAILSGLLRARPVQEAFCTGNVEAARLAPANIKSWGYQLQNLDLNEAAASSFDLLVIDPATDGSDDTALTAADILRLKSKPDGRRRLVLAYLSIGEAESYRSYWDARWPHAKPEWLLGENTEWKGNYAVRFWQSGWQNLMFGSATARLDRIIAAGFDGVYLDKCDVIGDLAQRFKTVALERSDLATDMVGFVDRLSAYAKQRSSRFLVVMQNAEELLARPRLRSVLDGVAKEELIYGCDGPERLNSPAELNDTRLLLDLMRYDEKFVLAVEYLDAPDKIQNARTTLQALGYAPCISSKNRSLAALSASVAAA